MQLLSILQRYWLGAGVGLAVLSAVLLPLNLLTIQPLHHDEALYATWALKIVSGDDPWLADTPIDKPPLFIYTVAGAIHLLGVTETNTRIPSLLATSLTVLLTFWLGQRFYNNVGGLLAVWLVALSPFTLLFAPTTFTDPMLVALVLAGCVAATYHRAGWAGFFMALAITTKQQGIFFVPLPMALLVFGFGFQVSSHRLNNAPATNYILRITFYVLRTTYPFLIRFIIILFLTLLPALVWDFMRNQPSGFFEQSLINYGGLATDFAGFSERWWGFIDLLYFSTASSILNTIFLVGCPLLLLYGLRQIVVYWKSVPSNASIHQTQKRLIRQVLTDWLLVLFTLIFLLGHALLTFQVWDRYLLGLIPFLALLLARILLLPWTILKYHWPNIYAKWSPAPALITGIAIVWLLAFTLSAPVQNAVNARYPLGSNSHALRGIKQITAYLQGNVGADTTLYHHWLGTHWRFYLWGYPYDLQYWDTPKALAARARPGQFLAYPTWRSDTELRLALFEAGMVLQEITRAYAPEGNPSIILYQIEPVSRNK